MSFILHNLGGIEEFWIELEAEKMQVLKKEVRDQIVRAAREEFRKTGFEKTSMRAIAAKAKMTVGNLYRYYEGKEELFGVIVSETVVDLEKMLDNTPKDSKSVLLYLLSSFKDIQKNRPVEWLILFGGSMGTKYERIAKKIHRVLEDSIADVLQRGERFPELAGPIASSIIFGLNSILQFQMSNKKTCEITNEFLNYMIVGFSRDIV